MAARHYQGRRVSKMPPKRSYAQAPGKRQAEPSRGGRRRMAQLVISALILLTVVGVKLTSPDVLDTYREKLMHLMGEDTDFVAAFSSVGRALGGEGLGEALDDAVTAVFGPQETEDAVLTSAHLDTTAMVYTAENTPAGVSMLQQVLGIAYQNPVEGTLSSGFGYREHPTAGEERFHYGLDIAAEEGSIITAFADGVVTAIGESADLGKYVELAHGGGCTTLYAHCSKVTASSGQTVRMGDPIAEVGETGDATGAHLHFVLCRNDVYLNPIYYVAY